MAGIATRLSRKGDRLIAALAELRQSETEVDARFQSFFPRLKHYSEQRRAIINYEFHPRSRSD